jgi:hypothetical protein
MTETDEVRRLRERVAQLELELAASQQPATVGPRKETDRRVIWRPAAIQSPDRRLRRRKSAGLKSWAANPATRSIIH